MDSEAIPLNRYNVFKLLINQFQALNKPSKEWRTPCCSHCLDCFIPIPPPPDCPFFIESFISISQVQSCAKILCAAFPIAKFSFFSGGGCEASAEAHSISVRLNLYMVRRSRDEMGRGWGWGGGEDGAGGERREEGGNVTCSLMCWWIWQCGGPWNVGDIHSTSMLPQSCKCACQLEDLHVPLSTD